MVEKMIKGITGIAYSLIRVSTEEQNEARQVIRMLNLGILKENIVVEKESGKSTVRSKYHELVKRLKAGDTLYIENIDRLSRDYDGIIKEWDILTRQKKITLKVIDTPALDTDQSEPDLQTKFMRDILLRVQAFQAESEWQKIKSRQAQGIAIAKATGKQLGRPKSVITDKEIKIIKQYQSQEITLDIALSLLGVKKSAFYKHSQAVSDMQD